ncbi:MAG: cell wall hydrolase [Nanoarchaeota archaeon]
MKPQKNEEFSFKRMFAYAIVPTIIACGINYSIFNKNLEKRLGARAEAEVVSPVEIKNYLTQNQEEKIETQKSNSRLENIVVKDERQIENMNKKTNSREIWEDYFTESDVEKVAEVMYGEGANQPWIVRYLIGRVIMNRIGAEGYPKTLDKVLYQYNGFSCTGADINNTWKQAIGKLPMNEYDKKVWKECLEISKYVLSGKLKGIPNEKKVKAYHDARVFYKYLRDDPKHRAYWRNLVHVGRYGNLEFYISIKDEKIPTKAPYFNGLDENHCAEYVRMAGEFYGQKFAVQSTDAWEFSEHNKLVAKIKGSLKGYENYLVPKKSAVTFYFKDSNFHKKAMKEAGNTITHVALYMGKNINGEMCFAEESGPVQRLRSYSQLINDGYSPREIVEPRR